MKSWVPLDKSEGPVKDKLSLSMRAASECWPEKVEDKDSGKASVLNHLFGGMAEPFHQPSIRPKLRP